MRFDKISGNIIVQTNILSDYYEEISIQRILSFSKIAKLMEFEICLGFSGGKDSQVIYDLCLRAGIDFKAYFNQSFESSITLKFIKEKYPDVIKRRDYNFGFIQNIYKGKGGLLPTVEIAYCCADYKHNPKYVDKCSIVGVRKAESAKRKERTAFEAKNKTILKKNKALVDKYFVENCQSVGTGSIIQLKPIIDWSNEDVWHYILKYNLPINQEYKLGKKRVGCLVCPKANFSSNFEALMKYPKLIDAFIKAREKGHLRTDWVISSDENKDYSDDKCYYICRWLNRSFRKFSKKQEDLYETVKKVYDNLHEKK